MVTKSETFWVSHRNALGRYAVGESFLWSIWVRCDQSKGLARETRLFTLGTQVTPGTALPVCRRGTPDGDGLFLH